MLNQRLRETLCAKRRFSVLSGYYPSTDYRFHEGKKIMPSNVVIISPNHSEGAPAEAPHVPNFSQPLLPAVAFASAAYR